MKTKHAIIQAVALGSLGFNFEAFFRFFKKA